MKNIYEDGVFSPEDSGEEKVADGFAKKEPSPHQVTRPKKQPTQPPLYQAPQPEQPQPQQYAPYYPGMPYMPYPPYPAPPQDPSQQPPSGVVYQGVPYAPYMPYYQPVPYPQQPQQDTPTQSDAPNPGTRVLFQSEDFDKPKRTDVIRKGESYLPTPEPEYDTDAADVTDAQEVSIEEIRLESKRKPAVKPAIVQSNQPEGVYVDDMEMSTFEFSAMAQKRNSTSRVLHQPGVKKGSGAVKGLEVEEIEDAPVENDDVFLRFPDDDDEDENPVTDAPAVKDGKKKLPKSEIIRRIVLSISLVAIVIASGMLLNEYRLSRENEKTMDEVSGLIIEEATTEKKKPSKNPSKPKDEEKEPTKPLTPEQQWAQIKAEYPNVIFPANLQLKYAKLYATNKDFVGYLSADGVNLNLPVVQRKDDEDEYYLKKNFYGKTTKYGCPFVTHLNNIDPLDQNTVIFGHHMNDGTVFGALDKYKTIDGFKAAPIITFNTMYKDYKWKVIAAFITNALDKEDNGYVFRYYFTSLSTEERFSAYLSELAQRSIYDTGVDVLPSDKLLTLSTCSHEFNEARFVVVARLVRDGELAEVDTMRASVNPNPRYPQAYYDKKGKSNPYKNAPRWEVG